MTMCRLSTLIAAALTAATLIACQSSRSGGFPSRSVDSDAQIRELEKRFADPGLIAEYYNITDAQADADSKRWQLRNKIADGRMALIDANYQVFVRLFIVEKQSADTGTDFAVIGLNTAGALIDPSSTTRILSGIAGGLVGVKSSYDKNFYYEQTVKALYAAMNAQRATVRARLLEGLQKPVSQYSLSETLRDLDEYYLAGSFLGGLESIQRDAGLKDEKAERKIDGIQQATYLRDKAGDLLRGYWKPDGQQIDSVNQKKIQDWMAKHGINSTIVFFMRAKPYADDRLQCAQDLGLLQK